MRERVHEHHQSCSTRLPEIVLNEDIEREDCHSHFASGLSLIPLLERSYTHVFQYEPRRIMRRSAEKLRHGASAREATQMWEVSEPGKYSSSQLMPSTPPESTGAPTCIR